MSPDTSSAGVASGKRNLTSLTYAQNYKIGDRWAIIVGISKCQYESLNLRYADRDAEEFYKLLLTPSGGGFEEDHVKKLITKRPLLPGSQESCAAF